MTFLNSEIIKFLFVGIVNTFVGYIVFSLAYVIFANAIVSLIIAYALGIIFNYETYSRYVFNNSNKQIFINFVIIYIGIFLFNNFLLYFFKNIMDINMYISQFCAIIIVTPILYILNKRHVFIEKEKDR